MNIDFYQGVVRCENELCNNIIGLLRYDHVLTILTSFRYCDLVYMPNESEHTPSMHNNLIMNRLIELDDPNYCQYYLTAAGFSAANESDIAFGPNTEMALNHEIDINYDVSTNGAENLINILTGDDPLMPNNAAIQISEVSSSSPDLEQLVNEIIGDDNYIDFSAEIDFEYLIGNDFEFY